MRDEQDVAGSQAVTSRSRASSASLCRLSQVASPRSSAQSTPNRAISCRSCWIKLQTQKVNRSAERVDLAKELGAELLRGVERAGRRTQTRAGCNRSLKRCSSAHYPIRASCQDHRPPRKRSPQGCSPPQPRDAGLSSGSAAANGSSACAQRAIDSTTGFSYRGGNRCQSPHHRPRQYPPALRGPRVRAARPGKHCWQLPNISQAHPALCSPLAPSCTTS